MLPKKYKINSDKYKIIHTEKIIEDTDTALGAAKKGKDTSLWLAMESLKNRDKDLAIATAEKDNQVNRLYNAILEEAPKIAGNEDLFNGLFRLVTCIRTLERGGDHAVDICELTHFLVTGKFKEF